MKKRIIDFETLVSERFEDYFNELSEEEQIELWNEYAKDEDEPEIIYQMGEFEEVYRDWELLDLISRLDSNFETDDEYFWTDMYDDICSSSDCTDAMDIDSLANWFAENCENDSFEFRSYCGAEYDEDGDLFIDDED